MQIIRGDLLFFFLPLIISSRLLQPTSAGFFFGSWSSSHVDSGYSSKSFRSAILHEEQVGINRFTLVGHITEPNAPPFTTTVLGFLKFRQSTTPGMCTVRGMLVPHVPLAPQSADSVKFDLNWQPRLLLRTSSAPDIQLELQTTAGVPWAIHQQDIPYLVNGSSPIAYTVHLDDWLSFAEVTPSFSMMNDVALHMFSAGFWVTWGYTNFVGRNKPPAVHAYIMFNHMQYHFKLGARGYLIYIDSTLLAPLLDTDPRIKQLMVEGKLRFMVWRGLPLHHRWPHAWLQVSYSHTALALWGADVYASLFDRDEVLGLPVGGSLKQLTEECGGGKAGLRLAMTLRHCELCAEDKSGSDVGTFMKVIPKTGGKANYYRLYKDKCEARNCHDKIIFHPRGVLRVTVHTVDMQRGLENVQIDRSCGTYVHMMNLFRTRYSATEFERWNCTMEREERWTWPLD